MPTNFPNDTSLAQQYHEDVKWLEQSLSGEYVSHDIQAMARLFSLSNFVRRVCYQFPSAVDFISRHQHNEKLAGDNATISAELEQLLSDTVGNPSNESDLLKLLRVFRSCMLATITARDLVQNQPIQVSLRQVSLLADVLIMAAYNWQYAQLSARYGEPVTSQGHKQPLCILAMGKLGGQELNFSSDIDLIFAYPEKGHTSGGRKSIENQQFFTKLAQRIIYSLDTVTADGFVYRVDMRLRPFGDSGPLVANFSALEDYYQQQGRDWERYAMLKARVVNPASEYSQQLMELLRPFVYRRYVDFTALESLRSMKQMIEKEVRRKRLVNNIKLGSGGIREVEFFIQSMQIVHAGKHPLLQTPALEEASRGLVTCNLLDEIEAKELLSDYYFLRKVEHCLQQINDEQTQQLPDEVINQQRLINMLSFRQWTDCYQAIEQAQLRINQCFHQLMETPEESIDQTDPIYALSEDLWALELNEHDWQRLLSPYADSSRVLQLFNDTENLKQRLSKIPMGQRGVDVLNRLMPAILFDILRDQTHRFSLTNISTIICSIAGRTAYLDLLLENHAARHQLFVLSAESEWISAQISRFPLLLDELLDPTYLAKRPNSIDEIRADFSSQLQQSLLRVDPDDLEALMNSWRQFKLCQQLIIAASDVCHTLPTNAVSDHLTALAEILLDSVIRSAWRDISLRYGEPEGKSVENSGLCVIAYGKFGGLELGYGSDLDLVFLHDAAPSTQTNGAKPVSATQFYVKLVQRIMHVMSTTTVLGNIYEVDLRLRPNGNSGLLCSHIDSFTEYQQENAWTWEHQALVRARPVWGPAALQHAFLRIRKTILCAPRDPNTVLNDVKEMREKMREHLLKSSDSGVDLKQAHGGITDIEFMTQYWVLSQAHLHPVLTDWPDNLRIIDSAVQAHVIPEEMGEKLKSAYLEMRQAIHQTNLQSQSFTPDTQALSAHREYIQTQFAELC
ncbi:bifunctional [glutamate--ammonia ligase]-adenylyl-L-tyrosine phosphorylase/[glutamate--ammonia-ligase] adenylyltransferase [Alteromonas facilis]|uniref:bifunctional [glutamate--ammonia ligase]-adenylyl-L-tyrosine phosphorylase/[glutamate--ammonia-ligase] adenylyltransferase n=1 Tax=Alteromonas facilis TaxID=2048004 RepID=UPI000C2943DD|nr:bifunctional [glutamate--ammonia ligase]-adenylyl-L-tyrosine phosphorylase/[glutamate--ammonia-ligase] adenylyltransferase [Alteromonas facilis]